MMKTFYVTIYRQINTHVSADTEAEAIENAKMIRWSEDQWEETFIATEAKETDKIPLK